MQPERERRHRHRRGGRRDLGRDLGVAFQDFVQRAVQQARVDAGVGDFRALLSVEDSGPGMPAWLVERIFEPFFTTKEVGQGTGLGLSVVHGLVRQHGGVMSVATAPGEGARFDIYLPLSTEKDGHTEC